MLETVGHYKVLEWLGTGAIGEMCRARDMRLGRTVALTIVAEEIAADPARLASFLTTAKAAASLSHPNIAALYDIGDDQAHTFFAQEFVPGERLAHVIAGHPLNARRAIEYGVQIADALADAHAAGIQHGDLNTHNVVVTPKGNVKIVDFGLAAWTRAAGRRPQPSDLVALGAVLFEMTTGKMIEDEGAVTAPSARNPHVPLELDAIVGRLIGRDRRPAYDSAAIAAAELRAVASLLDGRRATAPAPMPARSFEHEARSRRRLWAVAVVLLLLAAVAIWAALGR